MGSLFGRSALLAPALLLAFALPSLANATPGKSGLSKVDAAIVEGTSFKCEDGSQLLAEFSSRKEVLVALVNTGDGVHILPLREGPPNIPQITWSDGRRTLTWSPGVHLMFTEGETMLMCSRGMHHQH